ncbi:MAG: mucoidy inhibitor MuiA family protein [Coleofasciculus sp. Co-bin14]|nr:mucoidy inhibitor MuiA family protein [Coleofasciculus sp. Co-bin14]
MNKTVDTRISEVTVYSDQALVTRRGVVQLTGEERELVIAQLPVALLSDSVRVSGNGAVAVRLLGVQTERTSTNEELADKVAQLTQDIGQLEEQKRSIQDHLTLLNLQRTFVKNLSTQYLERLTRLPAPEPMNLEQIKELLNFVGHQYSEFSNAIALAEKEQKQLDKQLQLLRQQLQQLSAPSSQESIRIIVTVEPVAAGEFELEVSYIVTQVSWEPLYDLRLSTTGETINLGYLAEIKQSSGEDWLGVALTVSTAKPGLGDLPPKLASWYIDVQQTSELERRAKVAAEVNNLSSRPMPPTMPYPGMAPSPESVKEADLERLKAQMAAAEVFKQGGVVTFGVSGGGNIPSDGAPHKTTIFNQDYPCRTEYIAIPRLLSLAYLQTTITNPLSGVTLLSGKANIFRDNTFVGTTELENIAPGQEFQLNLGIDEGLKIERNLVERQVDKKLIGNQRRTTYAYQIVMTNLRDREVGLTLTEQLPVSRNEQVKVRLTRSSPQIQMSEMGMLEWVLSLPPLSKQEIYYQFTVEHPPELTVLGLGI